MVLRLKKPSMSSKKTGMQKDTLTPVMMRQLLLSTYLALSDQLDTTTWTTLVCHPSTLSLSLQPVSSTDLLAITILMS